MTMRVLALVPFFAITAVIGGCRATIPEGRFACTTDTQCPTGWRCVSSLCRTGPASDAGRLPDGSRGDAGGCGCADDGLFCNGSVVCTPTGCAETAPPCVGMCDEELDDCAAGPTVPVRFVNASATVPVAQISVGARMVVVEYGGTSSSVDAPMGSREFVVTDASGTLVRQVVLDLSEPSFVVLAPSTEPGEDTFYVVPDDLPPSGGGTVSIRLFDALRPAPTLDVPLAFVFDPAAGATGARAMELGEHAGPVMVPGGRAPMLVFSTTTSDVLAAFGGFAVAESALVVFSGNLDRHLGAPDGPRMFSSSSSSELVGSGPLYWVLNARSDAASPAEGGVVYACDLGRPTASPFPIPRGGISPLAPVLLDGMGDGRLGIAYDPSLACDPTGGTVIDISSLGEMQRHVVVALSPTPVAPVAADRMIVSEPAFDPRRGDDIVDVVGGHAGWQVTSGEPIGFFVASAPAVPVLGPIELGSSVTAPIDRSLITDVQLRTTSGRGLGTFDVPAEVEDALFAILVDSVSAGVLAPALQIVTAPYGGGWTSQLAYPIPM
jgi:hypothetical protein